MQLNYESVILEKEKGFYLEKFIREKRVNILITLDAAKRSNFIFQDTGKFTCLGDFTAL